VTIDGYSQPDASPNTKLTSDDAVLLIELNGNSSGADSWGLSVQSADVTIKGLVINRFGFLNVALSGNNAHLEGCFIGTDPPGTIARARGFVAGVTVSTLSPISVSIGGSQPAQRNLISGNSSNGFEGYAGTTSTIQGNFFVHRPRRARPPCRISAPTSFSRKRPQQIVGGLASPTGTPPGNVISGSGAAGSAGGSGHNRRA
jgi:hypothetical protein